MPQGPKQSAQAKNPFPIEDKPYRNMSQSGAFDDTGDTIVHFRVWKEKGRDASGDYSVQHRCALNSSHMGERETITFRNGKEVQRSIRSADGRLLSQEDRSYYKEGGWNRVEEKEYAHEGKARLVSDKVIDYAPKDNYGSTPRTKTTTVYGEDGSKSVTREVFRNNEWHQVPNGQPKMRSNAALERVADAAQHVAHATGHVHQQSMGDVQRAA